jgi:hypothetical protein
VRIQRVRGLRRHLAGPDEEIIEQAEPAAGELLELEAQGGQAGGQGVHGGFLVWVWRSPGCAGVEHSRETGGIVPKAQGAVWSAASKTCSF